MKLLLCLLLLTSCGSTSQDITTNSWVAGNYHSLVMQYNQQYFSGILPISMQDNEPLHRDSVSIKLWYTGSINIFSRACELNYSDRYDGDYLFPITLIRNCEISFNVKPDQYQGLTKHEINISGKIVQYVRKSTEWGLLINGDLNQHAMQIVEGTPSKYEVVKFKTYSDSGMLIGACSNGIEISQEYNNGTTQLLLSQLQNSSINSSSCQFRTIPYGEEPQAVGNLTINIFKPSTLMLEKPTPSFRSGRMGLLQPSYMTLTLINGKAYFNRNISIKYSEDKEYVITWITLLGRNATSIYHGSKLIWSSK